VIGTMRARDGKCRCTWGWETPMTSGRGSRVTGCLQWIKIRLLWRHQSSEEDWYSAVTIAICITGFAPKDSSAYMVRHGYLEHTPETCRSKNYHPWLSPPLTYFPLRLSCLPVSQRSASVKSKTPVLFLPSILHVSGWSTTGSAVFCSAECSGAGAAPTGT
jgi:hypothetical protein